jgi:hypothetical protein
LFTNFPMAPCSLAMNCLKSFVIACAINIIFFWNTLSLSWLYKFENCILWRNLCCDLRANSHVCLLLITPCR